MKLLYYSVHRRRINLWQELLVAVCSVQPVCTLSPWAGVPVGTAGASTQAPDNQAGFDQIIYLSEGEKKN